nr:helix-turn-helix transcriptional regulator [Faecalicoccus acidiformans]
MDDICKFLGYSKYYVLHVFQEVMELSVHDFIVRRRLTEVKSLLLEDRLTIEEIAQSCGFKSDIALYYKAFKRIYSITPGQFKKMNTMKIEEQ